MGKYYECKKCEPPSSFKNIHHPYYVILSPLLPPKIEFHYYDQLLTIKVELTLCGDFSLPINCLMLNFNSGLGDFSDIPLHLDWVADKKETGDRIQGHHY